MKWFMLKTVVGREKAAYTALTNQIRRHKLEVEFAEVVVPEQKTTQVKDGVTVEKMEVLFPGYLLVKMNLTPITQRVVNTCNQVKGFVSAGKDPMVFSDAEAEKMLQRLRTVVSAKEEAVSFAEGQKVRISEGPFKDFIGTVDSVQGSRVKVMVSVFGRPTSVELNPRDLKKELDREKAPA